MEIAAMTEKRSTDDIEKVLSFVLSLAQGVGKSLADGRISVWDLAYFFDSLLLAMPAIRSLPGAIKDMDDLDEKEKDDLLEYIDENFDVDTDHVDELVKKGLQAAVAICDLIDDFIDWEDEENED